MEAGVWHVVLTNHQDSRQLNRPEPRSQTPVAGTTSIFLSSTAGWARPPSPPAAWVAAQGCPVFVHHPGGHSGGCGLGPASPRVCSRVGGWRDQLITLRTSWHRPEEQMHRTACLLAFLIFIGEGHFLFAWCLFAWLCFKNAEIKEQRIRCLRLSTKLPLSCLNQLWGLRWKQKSQNAGHHWDPESHGTSHGSSWR